MKKDKSRLEEKNIRNMDDKKDNKLVKKKIPMKK